MNSSGREQMVMLLVGISCSFVLTFFLVAPPTLFVCTVHRLGIIFCYSLMFGALVKVQRVVRIFYSTKHNLKHTLPFISPAAQVCFTLATVAVQICLTAIDLGMVPPKVLHDHERGHEHLHLLEVAITCAEGKPLAIGLSLLYETFLIATVTLLGVLSFKLPDNFNEAKYISFCTFSLRLVSYQLTSRLSHMKRSTMISLFVILSAFSVLTLFLAQSCLCCSSKGVR